jgi:hypothetical protein
MHSVIMSKAKQGPVAARLAIDDKIVELRKRRLAALTLILALEAEGAIPEKPIEGAVNIDLAALRLLDGDGGAASHSVEPNANVRLYRLRIDLDVIDRALQMAGQRALVDHGDQSRGLIAKHQDEWRDLQRQRAELVIGLLRVNRKIENFKSAVTSDGQLGNLNCDGFSGRLLGVGILENAAGHWAVSFLKAAAKIGLVSERDFKDV